jgi:hypothetical protein
VSSCGRTQVARQADDTLGNERIVSSSTMTSGSKGDAADLQFNPIRWYDATVGRWVRAILDIALLCVADAIVRFHWLGLGRSSTAAGA